MFLWENPLTGTQGAWQSPVPNKALGPLSLNNDGLELSTSRPRLGPQEILNFVLRESKNVLFLLLLGVWSDIQLIS